MKGGPELAYPPCTLNENFGNIVLYKVSDVFPDEILQDRTNTVISHVPDKVKRYESF